MDTKEDKEEKVCISVDVVPFFDKHDYFGWRAKMKAFLKKYGIWEIVITTANPSKKKTKAEAQKEAKKNNATSLKKFWMVFLALSEIVLGNSPKPESYG